jgi:hypothetical protein
MITIKDDVLGKYSVKENFQGLEVIADGKTEVKVKTLDEALRYIANRLVLDDDATYNLYEYTQRRASVYNALRNAQETNKVEEQQEA